ncbi:MAG: carbohydrate binding domain-containing protein [Clostridia bacterium]|nr:carbohydrate binding domain-containing protein [Clostridia bacterium]
MNKKIIIVLLIAALALVALVGCNRVGLDTEIVVNGDFENYDSENSVAEGWSINPGTTANWSPNTNDGSSEYNSALGKRYFSLRSSGYNYIYQTVKLEKNATYRLSAYINAVSLTGTAGVYFAGSIDTIGAVVTEPTEGWQQIEQYFTSAVGGEVTLVAAVGRADASSSGTTDVRFDNISLQKVDGVADDVDVAILRMSEGYTMSDGGSTTFVILFTLISLGICVGMFFILRGVIQNKVGLHPNDGAGKGDKFLNAMTSHTASFIYVLLTAFVVRFIVVLASAEGNDIVANWTALAKEIASKGFISFYDNSFNDPQGVIWVLGILGYIAQALGLGDLGYSIILRLPMVIADLMVCYMIYSCASKYQNDRTATVYGFIYAILPVFFIFGTLYGSIQSIAIAFIVAMALSMLNKKYVSTGIFYTLALMFSNYALILLPVVLLYQIYGLVTDKSSVVKTTVTMASCFVVYYLLSLPLCWNGVSSGNVLMVFRKIYAFFEVSNPLLSDNTFNLYAIFAAGSRTRADNVIFNLGNWLFVIGMSAYVVYHYIKTANRLDLILLSAMMLIAYSALGTQSTLDIMPIGLVLMLIYLIITPDVRLYIGTSLLAAFSFLNISQLLSRSGFIRGVDNAGLLDFEDKNAFMIIFSILAVATVFYMLYVVCDITLNSYVKPIAKENAANDVK